MYVGVLVPIIPTFVEDELRGGELGIGLAIASFAGAAIVVRPLIGRLIERYGRRVVMVGGALLAAAAGVMYGYVDSLPPLLVLRAVSGVGEAALFVGAATLVADLSPDHRRAEGASYFSVAVYAGIGIGPIIGEAVLDSHGLRPAFTIAAAFAAVAAAVSLTLPRACRTRPVDAATWCRTTGAPRRRHRDRHRPVAPQPVRAPRRARSRCRARGRDGRVRGVPGVPARLRAVARAVRVWRAVRGVQRGVPRAPRRRRQAARASRSAYVGDVRVLRAGRRRWPCSLPWPSRGRCGRRPHSSAPGWRSCTRR